jgi:prolyl-tRNA synthetase
VVIVPILKKNADTESVLAAADALATAARNAGIRAKVDAGTEKTPGFKFSFWEMKVCTGAF